jgi:hypothetical protein
MNPYVFIVGAPRSGTTLLRRIVDAHPEIAITRETHWITKLMEGEDALSPDSPRHTRGPDPPAQAPEVHAHGAR